ncbi:MAG: HD family phosphohydrolase [Leptospiraceae bacterium]|nr:HD family phosphohydrolase [Leptospiraceae bacterium]
MAQAEEIKSQIDSMLQNIEGLPSFPSIVQKVLSMVSNPDANFQELAQEISRDPGLTAAIIRLSNSAYYSPSREIRSVQEAIVTLGLRTVKDIVLVTTSRGILKQNIEGYKLDAADLWDHSLLVAGISARVAEKIKSVGPDVAFTAGLMHDVGKVVLASFFRKIYRKIDMEMQANPELRFTELEKKYMGYTHGEVGAHLLKIWHFPRELIEAALYNYHPEKAKINPELTAIVHVANMIALSAGVGVDAGGMAEPLSKTALEKLHLSDQDLQKLYENLPELLEDLKAFREM